MRARLKDVAAQAGVAVNTASTILNRRPNSWASKETVERVFKAAADLGYKPSRAAVALRQGKFNTVGFLVPDLQNPFYAMLAEAWQAAMAARGYDLILESSRGDVDLESSHLETIGDRHVDGLVSILIDYEPNRPRLQKYFDSGMPVVAMHETGLAPLPVDAVTVDFRSGTTQAIQYLTGLGHRKMAFLLALYKGQREGARPEVSREIFQECGLSPDDVSFIRSDHTIAGARVATCNLLEQSNSLAPTAILAQNDLAAIGAIRGALDLGFSVPEEISIVGVDHTPIGQHLATVLTTVEQPVARMIDAAVELLILRMEHPAYAPPQQRTFSTRLILGESAAAPRLRQPRAGSFSTIL